MTRDLIGQGKSLVDNFYDKSRALMERILSEFDAMINDCVIPFFNWSWAIERSEFEKTVVEKMDFIRSSQLEIFYNVQLESNKNQFLRQMTQVFEQSNADMWDVIREYYYSNLAKREVEYLSKIKELFGDSEFEFKKFEDIAFSSVSMALKEKAKNLEGIMERRFVDLFKLDEKHIPRRWKPDDNIEQLWLQTKEKVETLIDLYSILRLTKEESNVSFFEKKESLEIKQIPPDIPPEHIILEPDECVRTLQKFRDRANNYFQEAIKEQESHFSRGTIPRFFILLLCILGFNEFQTILSWMFFSPISFIFSLFLLIMAYVVYALNLYPIIITILQPVISVLQDQLLAKIEDTVKLVFSKARGQNEKEKEKEN